MPLLREITHPHKRLQHLAGRYLLKELFPEFPYELIRIADTRKPFLENEAFHFSISHCGDYAAVMVSTENRVGVDVEMLTTKVEKVKHKFLSEKELQMIETIAGVSSVQLLTTAWSIKESLYKWYGSGEIDFRDHLQIESIHVHENNGVAMCHVLKGDGIALPVHFLIFNHNCISWVMSQG